MVLFETRVLRRMFGHISKEMPGKYKILNNEELHNSFI
jgi:hypothetical protein